MLRNRIIGLLSLCGVAAVAMAAQPSQRELAAREQAVHVLNRLAFGPRPGEVDAVLAKGVDRWIAEQLQPRRVDDRAWESFASQSYHTLASDQNDLLRQYADAQRQRQMVRRQAADSTRAFSREDSLAMRQRQMSLRAIGGELQSARVARAIASERQLQEVVTDFWLNHFNVFIRKGGPMPYYIKEYEDGIRERSLGSFRDLLEFTAKSPAMLFYLDNARSMADTGHATLAGQRIRRQMQRRGTGLNENYARELLELHSLGVDGGYTQQDVIEVARALTGWTIRQPQQGGGFIFRPEMHDADPKVILGHRFDGGRGIEDGDALLDLVAAHPSTARHIATKLARRFVSDTPSTALIEYAAGVFTRTRGDVRETVRAIVISPEFFSRKAYRSKVKSPFEVVVSAARALGAQPDATPRTALTIAFLGQPIYGHQAPNGYPETGESWMNTGAILNRINFGLAVAGGRLPGASLNSWPELTAVSAQPRAQQVERVVAAFLGGQVSPQTREILTAGRHPLVESGAVASAAETAVLGRMPVPQLDGLPEIIGLALGSPEFQRR